ncbi:tRNA (adenosine(37)-N6)-threonylcarbamoyltransferase complex dimerization subunit type 1 TsaB [Flavobacteriaceae bacterium AU392]|nr:tRNA (adenosine(37)-N6)-threonylcarbamoyltransferase complex dimerization subunit type 1 TsaB [Flavobacteriaceae bacterium]RKM81624.1 tRNA (adenosine(37)-N6)-threonylcarbamoyltransferase complex dimerization subunit type 1 TsaB [Flavobacteriaceae bacterium AU392]
MAYILNIETSTTNCSVSLSKDGETLVLKEDYNNNFSHAERLHMYIDDVLKQAKIEKQNLNAIAVSKGPGSYTGLRIGVSAVKGLCFALNKPLISVSTLEVLANDLKGVIEKDSLIVAMLDARRMEVYSAVFDSDCNQVRDIEAEVLNESSFNTYLKNDKVYFIGSGVEKTKNLITNSNAVFVEGKLPSANQMSQLSSIKYKKNDIEDVAYFEPYYLKDFVSFRE